jgi:ABC-type multidrug transport system ATPase subunit
MSFLSCFRNSDNERGHLVINGDRQAAYRIESDLAIAWIRLKFYGRRKCKRIPLLNDINGSIDLGTITALMGPSGAGKSTLLKCINGRQISGIDGNTDIYLNCSKDIRSCFIVQDVKEHLLSGLTAQQSLIYASKLKNHTIVCDHKRIAQNLLRELNIFHIRNTNVQECSGGEQKRLAIALELTSIGKPNLLCIDEPTSGLDSYAAEEVYIGHRVH